MQTRFTPSLAAATKLVYRLARLVEKRKKVAFLVGSGLTVPTGSHPGVPSTAEIVHLIQARLKDEHGATLFIEAVGDRTGAAAYQAAMQLLVECEGQSGLNEVISEAVLHVYQSTPPPQNPGVDTLEVCENDLQAWVVNPAVTALATIYNSYPELIGPILTSNFDPLVGITIRRLGGTVEVFPISDDGAITPFPTTVSHRRIVHFHGYWRGVDTLHTPDQITRSRPKLAGDLRKLLVGSSLVVLGYGGWDDVFMRTLATVIAEGGVTGDVLWAFRETDASVVAERYDNLLRRLEPQIGSRVILYGGVDANVVLPEVAERLRVVQPQQPEPSLNAQSYLTSISGGVTPHEQSPQRNFFKDPGCDPPPSAEYWTGRASEMNALSAADYRVCFITGIGGQGKSCLASAFLQNLVNVGGVEFWDWRDCREERNHMRTNLMNLCTRLSRGKVVSEHLKDVTDNSLVETAFDLLGAAKAVLVFDNVDQYRSSKADANSIG